jgi:hypothetical protein
MAFSTPTGLRRINKVSHNPVGVVWVCAVLPRVARKLATLGFGTESRWDSSKKAVETACDFGRTIKNFLKRGVNERAWKLTEHPRAKTYET